MKSNMNNQGGLIIKKNRARMGDALLGMLMHLRCILATEWWTECCSPRLSWYELECWCLVNIPAAKMFEQAKSTIGYFSNRWASF